MLVTIKKGGKSKKSTENHFLHVTDIKRKQTFFSTMIVFNGMINFILNLSFNICLILR